MIYVKQFWLLPLLYLMIGSYQTKMMKVRKGEVFKVVLNANHSTGYRWHWENKPAKNSIIDSVFADYILENKMVTGGGGKEIWEFKAKRKGDQKLVLTYKRPWEKKPPIEKREIEVRVE